MQNILIIGGNSGIGAALKNRLKANNNLYIASRNANEEEGCAAIAYDATLDNIDTSLLPDSIDALIYCPGSINLKPFKMLKVDDFQKDFEINVLGAVRSIQQVQSKMAEGSSILLFSSVAVQTGMPFHASVAVAKAGIEGLTRSLAAEFAPKIRVNAIAPSLVDTPLAQKLLSNEQKVEKMNERHPLGRVGKPDDIAAVAEQLVSKSGSWITGQVFTVDGGISSMKL